MKRDDNRVTEAEMEDANALEEHMRPHVVAAWDALPVSRRPRCAVVAGYFDHAANAMMTPPPPRPARRGRMGVGIYDRLQVLDALTRAGEDELAEVFRYCDPTAIPVMLCAWTHIAMVYLLPAPADAVTVGRGGDA